MGRALPVIFTLLFLPVYIIIQQGTWESRTEVREAAKAGFVLPSKFSRIMAFGYKGLLSDYQFLRILTFYGERDLLGQSLSEEDWQYFIKSIDVVTDLDPYFFDPYLLTEGLLTWEAGKIVDANRLLEKGFKYRKNDWRIPYFIGFNYFYFLKNYENGSEYVMAASRLPGSPSYLPNLAARLAYYGEKSETAILFLREMLGETQDPKLLSSLEIRLLALERAAILEKLVTKFVSEQGRELRTMRELVEKGYIDEIPEDPYGGKWGILPNGRVFSTSRFVPVIPDESSATD